MLSLRVKFTRESFPPSTVVSQSVLHETVVAWFRGKLRRTKPQVLPWEETRTQWAARAVRCARAINADYNVAGLCAEFPDRLQACMDHGGERLAK